MLSLGFLMREGTCMRLDAYTIFSEPELRTRVRAYLLDRFPRGEFLLTDMQLLQLRQVPPATLDYEEPPAQLGDFVVTIAKARFAVNRAALPCLALGVRLVYEDLGRGELVPCGWRPFRLAQHFSVQRPQLVLRLNLFTRRPRHCPCSCVSVEMLC